MIWAVALIPALAVSCYTDWRSRRVLNVVTLPLALGGWLASLVAGGPQGLLSAAGCSLACACAGAMGGRIGMGDFKLLLGVGAWLPASALPSFLAALICIRLAAALATRLQAAGWRVRRFTQDVKEECRLGSLWQPGPEHAWPGAWGISAAVLLAGLAA